MGVTKGMQGWKQKEKKEGKLWSRCKINEKNYIIKKEKVALYRILKELMFFLKDKKITRLK